jgi:hypothetical protein
LDLLVHFLSGTVTVPFGRYRRFPCAWFGRRSDGTSRT